MTDRITQKMIAGEAHLTQARLREVLDYNPETGIFKWVAPRGSNARPDGRAGSPNDDGYIIIAVDGRKYRAHRLAWLWVHGRFPSGLIDHKNCVRDDNRIDNLRDSTKVFNQQNQRAPFKNNRLGIRGVYLHMLSGRFGARIGINKKVKHIGYFDTAEEAHAAYVEAKRKHHEGCTL